MLRFLFRFACWRYLLLGVVRTSYSPVWLVELCWYQCGLGHAMWQLALRKGDYPQASHIRHTLDAVEARHA